MNLQEKEKDIPAKEKDPPESSTASEVHVSIQLILLSFIKLYKKYRYLVWSGNKKLYLYTLKELCPTF